MRVWLRPKLKWAMIVALGFGLVALEPASAFPRPVDTHASQDVTVTGKERGGADASLTPDVLPSP